MRLIDEEYTRAPFYGIRKITAALRRRGICVNHKKVARLMQLMGIQAIFPGRKRGSRGKAHKVWPYLLRDFSITRPDQVWASDITYIRLLHGFVYLVAVLDWYSRYVLAWAVSMTMESQFCVGAMDWALQLARPDIVNVDQGSQFTAENYTKPLIAR